MYTTIFHHHRFGHFLLSASANGITGIKRIDKPNVIQIQMRHHPVFDRAKSVLSCYFDGKAPFVDVPLDLTKCSSFQAGVLGMVADIPYGQTSSYLDLAVKLGDQKLTRAVGNANAKNPVPILIPCHRVIGSDGNLRGYIFGAAMKKTLLAMENPNSFSVQGNLF